jgi:hypothetical protein
LCSAVTTVSKRTVFRQDDARAFYNPRLLWKSSQRQNGLSRRPLAGTVSLIHVTAAWPLASSLRAVFVTMCLFP